MGLTRQKKVPKPVAKVLELDEVIELNALAKLGSVAKSTAKAAVKTVAASVVVGALTGGAWSVGFSGGVVYFVLTDRRLLMFKVFPNTSSPAKLLADFPRHAVRASEPRFGVFGRIRLDIEGSNEYLTVSFAPIPPSLKRNGKALAAALGAPIGL